MEGKSRSVEMLKRALEIETKGKAFYDDAIAKCKNTLGKEIFTTLREDEVVHLGRIKKIYDSLESNGKWDGSWEGIKEHHRDVTELFDEIAHKLGTNVKSDDSDLKALDVGIDFEWKTVKFYEDNLKLTKDPLEKKFIEKMIAEEKGHHKILKDMKFYLSDPAAWFVENEHHEMDAG